MKFCLFEPKALLGQLWNLLLTLLVLLIRQAMEPNAAAKTLRQHPPLSEFNGELTWPA
jgi:hypothetical protein